MRILLINSNTFHYPWPVIPFGLCYVASALEGARERHSVQLLDLCFAPDSGEAIERAVAVFRPDLIGLTIRNIDNGAGYSPLFLLNRVRDQVVRPCQRVFDGPIIIGGPAVGINGNEILSMFDLELAVRGDGEQTMVELVRRLEGGQPLDGLPGLVRREAGGLVQNEPPRQADELDELAWPELPRWIDVELYRRYGSPLQVQTKRGCELRCTYCTYRRIEGCRYRLRNPEAVADEVADLVCRTGITDIEITDSTFNLPLDHAKAVLRALLDRGLSLRLRTLGLNPSGVDEELVDLMSRVGFREVDLGVESGSDSILTELGKSFTVEEMKRAGRLLHDRGIAITWYLLIGAPSETRETVRQTLETIRECASSWDLVLIAVGLRAYNGAPLAEELRREDPAVTTDNFLTPAVIEPQAITLREIAIEVKRFCLGHSNFLMYNEEYDYPVESIRLMKELGERFNRGRPYWQTMIFFRRVFSVLGVARLQRGLFELSNLQRPYSPHGGYGPERVRGPRV